VHWPWASSITCLRLLGSGLRHPLPTWINPMLVSQPNHNPCPFVAPLHVRVFSRKLALREWLARGKCFASRCPRATESCGEFCWRSISVMWKGHWQIMSDSNYALGDYSQWIAHVLCLRGTLDRTCVCLVDEMASDARVEWRREGTFLLIREYETRRCLWDVPSPLYRDRMKKHDG
jgi:hypothetical protein